MTAVPAAATSAAPTPGTPTPAEPVAADVVAHTLLNCFLREVSVPEQQTSATGRHLVVRLPRQDALLRIAVRRWSMAGSHRFAGPVHQRRQGAWVVRHWSDVARLITEEMRLLTGRANDEFLDQVRASHAGVVAAITAVRSRPGGDPRPGGWRTRFLESEQSLAAGHRFHPTPKSRGGSTADWGRYAPEAGVAFRLRHLAVRNHLVAGSTAAGYPDPVFDRLGDAPDGFRLLPVHPWQWSMLAGQPALARAVHDGDVLDLGRRGAPFAPTASVRTLAGPEGFLKFGLNVRITNCVRRSAAYELTGAVLLTELLTPTFAALETRHPGVRFLREPAFRTLSLATGDHTGDRELFEGLGVIEREGLGRHLRPGVEPLLAAAVCDEYPFSTAHVSHLIDLRDPLRWWERYLGLLVPPVLTAFFEHGVVLEAHLQNVVVGVDQDGMPAQVFFRDLEGTKLVDPVHHDALTTTAPENARQMTYDRSRGWSRVAYCLLVNHLCEMVGAISDLPGVVERQLWAALRRRLLAGSAELGEPPELQAVLAGVPLPAKANLSTRWARQADREAGYVPVPLPLGPARPARSPAC
jgi:siderophore synthetase component